MGMPKVRERIQKNKPRSLLWENILNSIGIYRFAAHRNTPPFNGNDGFNTKQRSVCKGTYILENAIL